MMGSVRSNGCNLDYEEVGQGVPILLIHPAGATAATWGSATQELARVGRVLTYDRRGYARSGGHPVRSVATHTAAAAAILESLGTPPAVVVGTSAGAAIAVDLAVRRPELVRVVIAHEFPWRFTRHLPTASQVVALVLRGRQGDAAEALLRSAYSYRDGGSAWDAFPEAVCQLGKAVTWPPLPLRAAVVCSHRVLDADVMPLASTLLVLLKRGATCRSPSSSKDRPATFIRQG